MQEARQIVKVVMGDLAGVSVQHHQARRIAGFDRGLGD
jgi:hypothetical protein